jgi:hypothetical protein
MVAKSKNNWTKTNMGGDVTVGIPNGTKGASGALPESSGSAPAIKCRQNKCIVQLWGSILQDVCHREECGVGDLQIGESKQSKFFS